MVPGYWVLLRAAILAVVFAPAIALAHAADPLPVGIDLPLGGPLASTDRALAWD
jgi:hypothetical protein